MVFGENGKVSKSIKVKRLDRDLKARPKGHYSTAVCAFLAQMDVLRDMTSFRSKLLGFEQ